MASQVHPPSPLRSLSARLLVLTIAFVLLGEILIYVPSIARFRKVYLDERIAAAHLATLSLEAAGQAGIDSTLENELLSHAGVLSVTLREPAPELMLGKLPPVEKVLDLRAGGPLRADRRGVRDAAPPRPAHDPGDRPLARSARRCWSTSACARQALWNAMVNYSWRILTLSIVISLLTAVLVYAALQLAIVRPLGASPRA